MRNIAVIFAAVALASIAPQPSSAAALSSGLEFNKPAASPVMGATFYRRDYHHYSYYPRSRYYEYRYYPRYRHYYYDDDIYYPRLYYYPYEYYAPYRTYYYRRYRY
jgi:hypothetical protein